jgi:putative sigma-54 modulation protein
MRVTVSGRHVDVTPALKEHVEKGLQKVRAHFSRPKEVMDANVVLTVEKHRQTADITLHMNGIRIHGKDTGSDMYSSIDKVVEKLDKQVRKYRDRINDFEPRRLAEASEMNYQRVEVEDAMEDGAVKGSKTTVIHREKLTMRPMTLDEARMQLDLIEDDFLVFLNVDSFKVNVLYDHKDGTLGLIEPQY